jgi:hypothetical protein
MAFLATWVGKGLAGQIYGKNVKAIGQITPLGTASSLQEKDIRWLKFGI